MSQIEESIVKNNKEVLDDTSNNMQEDDAVSGEEIPVMQNDDIGILNMKAGKKIYNKIGWKYVLYFIAMLLGEVVWVCLGEVFGQKMTDQPWYPWGMIAIPTYFIGYPILLLIIRKMKVVKPQQHSLGFGKIIKYIVICAGLCGLGVILGSVTDYLIMLLFGGQNQSSSGALVSLMMESQPFWRIVTVGFLAPIFEELIFRKALLDRIGIYGEKMAIITSGLMFGLFHGNFSQFYFATLLGMLFAYVYLRTGKVWYTILFHAVINLSTSVITVFLVSKLDVDLLNKITVEEIEFVLQDNTQAICWLICYYLWILFTILCSIVGVIMLFISKKKIVKQECEAEMPKKGRLKATLCNPGMIMFYILSSGLFIFTYIQLIAAMQ